MPSHFNLCLRIPSHHLTARTIADPILHFLSPRIGAPREVMMLNYRLGEKVTVDWDNGESLLDRPLVDDQLMFIYLAKKATTPGARSSISIDHGKSSWIFTLSLIEHDLFFLTRDSSILQIGIELYDQIKQMARELPFLVGGYEVELSGESSSVLAAMKQILFTETLVDFAIYPLESNIAYNLNTYIEEQRSEFCILSRRPRELSGSGSK